MGLNGFKSLRDIQQIMCFLAALLKLCGDLTCKKPPCVVSIKAHVALCPHAC